MLKKQLSTKQKVTNIKQIKATITKVEHCKVSKLLNDSTVLKYVIRKWIAVNDITGCQYSTNKNISFKIPMLRLDLCD